MSNVKLDTLIIGGGIAGLWILDRQVERGRSAGLLEAQSLGEGQSISAQGILHGGTKYALSGLVPTGAREVSAMPGRWAESLTGTRSPDLSGVRVRTPDCHLWRTDSVRSIVGMVGAKVGLAITPSVIEPENRPAVLRSCPGDVALLPEQVIEMPSVLETFRSMHQDRLLHGTVHAISNDRNEGYEVIAATSDGASLTIHASRIVMAAGRGNEALLAMIKGRNASRIRRPDMQLRPLHMGMVRGPEDALPELNGHCVDGGQTRVTITSSTAEDGSRVWQLGGRLAEDGCSRSEDDQRRESKACLDAVLPGFDSASPALEWATYRIDRAELKTRKWTRPDGAFVSASEDIITVWPTKMVLAPNAAEKVDGLISPHAEGQDVQQSLHDVSPPERVRSVAAGRSP